MAENSNKTDVVDFVRPYDWNHTIEMRHVVRGRGTHTPTPCAPGTGQQFRRWGTAALALWAARFSPSIVVLAADLSYTRKVVALAAQLVRLIGRLHLEIELVAANTREFSFLHLVDMQICNQRNEVEGKKTESEKHSEQSPGWTMERDGP